MKKIKEQKKTTKNHMLSVRVPRHLIGVLKDFKVNISEMVNEAIRNRVLEEIGRSRKK